MKELINKLKDQLNLEAKEAVNNLTASRLDVIYKLTAAICYLEKMDGKEWE